MPLNFSGRNESLSSFINPFVVPSKCFKKYSCPLPELEIKFARHTNKLRGSYFCYLDLQSQISVLFLLVFVQRIFRFLLVLLHQQQQLLYIVQFHFSRMLDKKVTSRVVLLIHCNHRDVDNVSYLQLVMLNVQQVYLHSAIDLLRNRRKTYHFVISVLCQSFAIAIVCHPSAGRNFSCPT